MCFGVTLLSFLFIKDSRKNFAYERIKRHKANCVEDLRSWGRSRFVDFTFNFALAALRESHFLRVLRGPAGGDRKRTG